MKTIRKQRMFLIIAMVIAVMGAVAFALKAFNENLMYFYSVSQVANNEAPKNQAFRLGGMVVEDSVKRPGEGLTVFFDLTDYESVVTVNYTGILPDLFREGQGLFPLVDLIQTVFLLLMKCWQNMMRIICRLKLPIH